MKIDPRAKQLQHVARLYCHLLSLMGKDRPSRLLMDSADINCTNDHSASLRAELQALRDRSIRGFDSLLRVRNDDMTIAVWDWWEKDRKTASTSRRKASHYNTFKRVV